MTHPYGDAAPAHFLAKLPKPLPPNDQCWRWGGHTRPNGYGELSNKGKTVLAHRLAYQLATGEIPPSFDIDHVRAKGCVHRDCVNPNHLEAVDHAENMVRQGDASPLEKNKERFRNPELARQAAMRSVEVRRQRAIETAEQAARDQAAANLQTTRRDTIVDIIDTTPRHDLAARTHEAAVNILDLLLTDEIPIRNGKEAADLLTCLHTIKRLEQGEPTALTASLTGDLDTMRALLLSRIQDPATITP